MTLDLSKYTICNSTDVVNNSATSENRTIAVLVKNANVTVKGDGRMESKGNYVLAAGDGGNITVEGGNFDGTIYVKGSGNVTIIDGYFKRSELETGKYAYDQYTCLNENGSATGSIVVKGGTFLNFNPAANCSESDKTSFVAEGYKVRAVKNGVIVNENTSTAYYSSNASSSGEDVEYTVYK